MVIVPLLVIVPAVPALARMPIAPLAPVMPIVPALVTLLLLSMVTAVPEVGLIDPALVMLMSAGALLSAVEVFTGVVCAAPIETVAAMAGETNSPSAIGVRQVEANRRRMKPLPAAGAALPSPQ